MHDVMALIVFISYFPPYLKSWIYLFKACAFLYLIFTKTGLLSVLLHPGYFYQIVQFIQSKLHSSLSLGFDSSSYATAVDLEYYAAKLVGQLRSANVLRHSAVQFITL